MQHFRKLPDAGHVEEPATGVCSMQLSPREKLRHDVRAVVHRACWRRVEGDAPGAHAQLDTELAQLIEAAGETAPESSVVREWVGNDREDFERGLLIGDIVARRLRQAAPVAAGPAPAAFAAPASAPAAAPSTSEVPGRLRRTEAPGIADLLDDMLDQDRRARGRS